MEELIKSCVTKIIQLPRVIKRIVMFGLDQLFIAVSLWSVFIMRSENIEFSARDMMSLYLISHSIAIPLFIFFGFYHVVHRYVGERFFVVTSVVVSLYAVLFSGVIELALKPGFAWSAYVQHWGLCLGAISGGRWIGCKMINWFLHMSTNKTRIIVYGAGSAGAELVATLMKMHNHVPLAFIDDKSELCGNEILGLKVHPPGSLGELIKKYGIQEVFVAIPSASRHRMREVVDLLGRFPVKIKTVPPLLDIISGRLPVSDIREVGIEDLLGRDSVQPDEELMKKCIMGKTVLVTGAGGSIGSELASQIVLLESSRLILYEISEAALYQVENRIRSLCKSKGVNLENAEIIPVLGSVLDETRIKKVIRAFGVETIYHAAAYKHVPMVEMNPVSGVSNNLFGTWHTVRATLDTNVETFIFISTDKAVRPTSIMGASKRLSELIVQGASEIADRPHFSIVRFGNVLGSSGSIVPLLKEQIRQGGPVTVTHPEVVRYFMSIPEAAQLVIQAGSLGKSGDVFVLDMGDPIKIIDLARRMIHLSGLTIRDEHNPKGDIGIVITGLRPGEKLYEELLIAGDNIEPTEHPRIMRAHEENMPWPQLMKLLSNIERCCASGDVEKLRHALLTGVSGYSPQCDIKDPVWLVMNDHKNSEFRHEIEHEIDL